MRTCPTCESDWTLDDGDGDWHTSAARPYCTVCSSPLPPAAEGPADFTSRNRVGRGTQVRVQGWAGEQALNIPVTRDRAGATGSWVVAPSTTRRGRGSSMRRGPTMINALQLDGAEARRGTRRSRAETSQDPKDQLRRMAKREGYLKEVDLEDTSSDWCMSTRVKHLQKHGNEFARDQWTICCWDFHKAGKNSSQDPTRVPNENLVEFVTEITEKGCWLLRTQPW